MPMSEHMNVPWHMGGAEWLELVLFWNVTLVVFVVLVVHLVRRPTADAPRSVPAAGWRSWPEVRLLVLALPLELLWETAQFPLYDVWHQNDWGYILYGLAHCTLGDLLILLVLYGAVALLSRNRFWYSARPLSGGLLFTALGVGYTIFSEIMNTRVKGTWGYTDLMPIVPVINVGGMPLLQWLLIPPVLLWLMRMFGTSQAARS